VGREMRDQVERRQLLLEALDKLARYQRHYSELHGRYTRDLARLSVPSRLTSGTQEALRRHYEISVLEVRPSRFLILASGVDNSDRVTIDESHRINANFVLPAPARAYLFEEAERMIRLTEEGLPQSAGLVSRYWQLRQEDGASWVAVGVRAPVMGERRAIPGGRGMATIFSSVREKMQSRLSSTSPAATRMPAEAAIPAHGAHKEILDGSDVSDWLLAAHQAQHVHLRERGRFAARWEELDSVSDYYFSERMRAVKNLRVHPIELSGGREGYRLVVEGTSGDLQGEQFMMDSGGVLRQVRYTEALIQQLQETTNILEIFQINPIADDSFSKDQP